MRNIATCPPITPEPFKPSDEARDAHDAAVRACADASAAELEAKYSLRAALADVAIAEKAFGDEDSDERWKALEGARRRSTAAEIRAKRCAAELEAATANEKRTAEAIHAEKVAYFRELTSPDGVMRMAKPALLDLARGIALLIRAARARGALARAHAAATLELSRLEPGTHSLRDGAIDAAFLAVSGYVQVATDYAAFSPSSGTVSTLGDEVRIAQLLSGTYPDHVRGDLRSMIDDLLREGSNQ